MEAGSRSKARKPAPTPKRTVTGKHAVPGKSAVIDKDSAGKSASAGTRVETDSMGAIEVANDRYWGAQTERSLLHFSIGFDRMPRSVVRAFGILKKAGAEANRDLGKLPPEKSPLLIPAAHDV